MLKKFCVLFSLLLIFGVSPTLIVAESVNDYFPHTSGSFWVYADQDRNELTRRAVEEKNIEGETYHAFGYESAVEDWTDYEHYIHPNFYQIRKDGIVKFVRKSATSKVEKSLELTHYEIKSTDLEEE